MIKSKITLVNSYIKKAYRVMGAMLLISIMVNNSTVQAYEEEISHTTYRKIMTKVEEEFRSTPSVEEKYAVISRPMNLTYLSSLKQDDEVDFESLYAVVDKNDFVNRTNALALAVCAADEERVLNFLASVNDPNDPSFTIAGYRQRFNMAHLAADPQFPFIALEQNGRPMEGVGSKRLTIMDLIYKAGFDFNFQGSAHYCNRPIAAGIPSGHPVKGFKKRQARALLYGADPKQEGNAYCLVNYPEDRIAEVMDLAYCMLVKGEVENPKLAPYTQERFKVIRERMNQLSL